MKVSKSDAYVEYGVLRIGLYREENGKDIRDISVFIDKNGDLRIDGYDFGPAVEKITGKDDYEFWTTVKANDKPLVYEALKAELFDSEASYAGWIDDLGIDVVNEFDTALLCLIKQSGKGRDVQGFANWAKGVGADATFRVW